MKKVIFGIFAHPDDEAFGPAGTLLKEVKEGTELHLICLTPGDSGTNPDNAPDLGTVREKEWRIAGERLGATSMELLGYQDGHLNNLTMIEVAKQLVHIVSEKITDDTTEIEFMSLDLNGYTGHIDHIVAARAACLAFYRLKQQDNRFTRIRLACLPSSLFPKDNTDWIYAEAGRTPDQIDETVDARAYKNDILHVMDSHISQRADKEYTLKSQGQNLGLNYFIVKR